MAPDLLSRGWAAEATVRSLGGGVRRLATKERVKWFSAFATWASRSPWLPSPAQRGPRVPRPGTLTGRVESADGQALPGVTVAVSAPSLQGERSATTTANGDYIFKGLPAGRYRVTFTMSGFSTVDKTTSVELAQSSTVNATLSRWPPCRRR